MRDGDLVDLFLAGDAETVETVTDWVRASAYPFRRRMKNEWDDGVQEALTHVVERLAAGSFQGRSSLKTWVWRLTGYRFVDRHRRRKARPTEELVLELGEPKSQEADPLDDSLDRERRRVAARILGRTSEACRRLWEMLFAGQSRLEMSEELGIREGTLRVRLHRCRQQAIDARVAIEEESRSDRA